MARQLQDLSTNRPAEHAFDKTTPQGGIDVTLDFRSQGCGTLPNGLIRRHDLSYSVAIARVVRRHFSSWIVSLATLEGPRLVVYDSFVSRQPPRALSSEARSRHAHHRGHSGVE